jgi:hypothetical protein
MPGEAAQAAAMCAEQNRHAHRVERGRIPHTAAFFRRGRASLVHTTSTPRSPAELRQARVPPVPPLVTPGYSSHPPKEVHRGADRGRGGTNWAGKAGRALEAIASACLPPAAAAAQPTESKLVFLIENHMNNMYKQGLFWFDVIVCCFVGRVFLPQRKRH